MPPYTRYTGSLLGNLTRESIESLDGVYFKGYYNDKFYKIWDYVEE